MILTGRDAHEALVEVADTVTRMDPIKHAFEKGIKAQKGIEILMSAKTPVHRRRNGS